MAYWQEGDRVRYRLGDRREAAGTVAEAREETGVAASPLRKLLRSKVPTGERVTVRWDHGCEGE